MHKAPHTPHLTYPIHPTFYTFPKNTHLPHTPSPHTSKSYTPPQHTPSTANTPPPLHSCTLYRGVCRISQGGGAQLQKIFEVGYTCRKAACREQRSCEPLLGGFGGMPPQENFKKWCNFVGFEGYFQPLS